VGGSAAFTEAAVPADGPPTPDRSHRFAGGGEKSRPFIRTYHPPRATKIWSRGAFPFVVSSHLPRAQTQGKS
jgi:hypothetical protein